MAEDDLYHRDFYRWTRDQANRLRVLAQRQAGDAADPADADQRQLDAQLDAVYLAEEVAQAGRLELHRVAAHLTNTLVHLLEAAWLSEAMTDRRWRGEARSTAREACRAFTDGMRPCLDIQEIWTDALDEANARLGDTGRTVLPRGLTCPLTLDDLLVRRLDTDGTVARLRVSLLGDEA